MTRIAFIGAGSVVFTKNLLGDILELPALRDVEIALHDIDPDRLDTAEAMARWVARKRGAEPRISVHLDRRAALADIDLGDFGCVRLAAVGHVEGNPQPWLAAECDRRDLKGSNRRSSRTTS